MSVIKYFDTSGVMRLVQLIKDNFASISHSHSDYANKNAFSKISVAGANGSTTIEADTTTDTLNLAAGTNITLTADAGGDKITINGPNLSNYATTSALTTVHNHYLGHSHGGYLTTHDNFKNIVGGSNKATSNASATNGNVYLNQLVKSTITSSHNIVGSGGLVVTSDANGKITISLENEGSLSDYAKKEDLTKLLDYKGTVGTAGTISSLPAQHAVGDTYVVKNATTSLTTIAGKSVQNGDMFICITDGTSTNNDHWTVVQGNCVIENKNATIGTSLTTIATIDGVDIKAKISNVDISHIHADYINQNAFSNITVIDKETGNSTVIESDKIKDNLNLIEGNYINLTGDVNDDSITISVDATVISDDTIDDIFNSVLNGSGSGSGSPGTTVTTYSKKIIVKNASGTSNLSNTDYVNISSVKLGSSTISADSWSVSGSPIYVHKTTGYIEVVLYDSQNATIQLNATSYYGVNIPVDPIILNKNSNDAVIFLDMTLGAPEEPEESEEDTVYKINMLEQISSSSAPVPTSKTVEIKSVMVNGGKIDRWDIPGPFTQETHVFDMVVIPAYARVYDENGYTVAEVTPFDKSYFANGGFESVTVEFVCNNNTASITLTPDSATNPALIFDFTSDYEEGDGYGY